MKEMANNSFQTKQAIQLQKMVNNGSSETQQTIQKKENNTGLPNNLKTGMESLSDMSMDDVKVHYNSGKPAQLQAHAYAQGAEIHLGPGQEKHLPHELGHVVQQKEGRVKPTMQLKGKVNVNDDAGLEKEADMMGAKALNYSSNKKSKLKNKELSEHNNSIQKKAFIKGKLWGFNEKTKTKREEGEQQIIEDPRSMYFSSKDEMSEFAKEETDNLGFYKNTWIRLLSDEIIVLGELHSGTTLNSIANAVGTNRYKHEGFTEYPDTIDRNTPLKVALDVRSNAVKDNDKHGYTIPDDDNQRHFGEDFYPKILRGIAGDDPESVKVSNFELNGAKLTMMLLSLAILDASEVTNEETATEEEKNLYNVFNANRDIYIGSTDKLLENKPKYSELSKKMKDEQSNALYTNFRDSYVAYAYSKIKKTHNADPKSKEKFDNNWRTAEDDYFQDKTMPIMKAEKERDFSMYQKIKEAKKTGTLLFGIGNLHLERLKPLLDSEGIKNYEMVEFIEDQKKKHPQK